MKLSLTRIESTVNPEERNSAVDYLVYDEALVAATEAAIALGKPLLLTGEPGIGKSVYARWIAHQLGGGDCLKYVIKSDTAARDLFYQFNTLERFRDNQRANTSEPSESTLLKYVSYNALGWAFLNSMGQNAAERAGLISAKDNRFEFEKIVETPCRSVVLIDEIDKAPRDVPNDILDEIDTRVFRLQELDNLEVVADPAYQPVVVITSNSERDLPKPFLRRCIYYHMHIPEQGFVVAGESMSSARILADIANARIGARYAGADNFIGDAVRVYQYIRDHASLRHQPGVAELLDWLGDMAAIGVKPGSRLKDFPEAALLHSLQATLCKDPQDQKTAVSQWQEWLTQAVSV